MNVALHDADKTRFPNLALMKLSAWNKKQGDSVSWFQPLLAHVYDVIYSSKVFTFTPNDPYLPDDGRVHKGGTGYGVYSTLPNDIEHCFPDYSLYPDCDFSLGFLTRGCIRSCPWCVVPKKEGAIRGNAFVEEFLRDDSRNVVLMDNNVLASDHGLSEIERMAAMNLRVDFNQGLDARIIADSDHIARLLSALRWFKPLRLACDQKSQMPAVEAAVARLREHGCKPTRYFCYVLVQDVEDALQRVEFLRRLAVDPFAQPYRDAAGTPPTQEQKAFARWVNRKEIFQATTWQDYKWNRQKSPLSGGQGAQGALGRS